MSDNEETCMDFIRRLADLNLYIVVETIVQHAGYEATVNMLCVSKAWNHILMDIGLWRRLLKRRLINDVKFKQLCHLNGWGHHFRQEGIDTKTLAYFFFASTDLKDLMKVPLDSDVTCLRTFDFINTLLLHGDLLVCGMINGRIKVWTLSDVNSNSSPRPRNPEPHVIEGHTKSVFAMAARDNVLVTASGTQDKTVRIWDLESREQIHSVQYENLLKCQRLELTATHLVAWYMSEAVIDRAFRSRGELVLWKLGPDDDDGGGGGGSPAKFAEMAYAGNVPFSRPLNGERVKMGDVGEQYSVVGYPTQILVYQHGDEGFSETRKIPLPADHWLYLLKVFRSMLVTVVREGSVETIHSLQDDVVEVKDISSGDFIYRELKNFLTTIEAQAGLSTLY